MRKAIIPGAAAILLCLALSSCGSPNNTTQSTDTATQSPITQSPTAQPLDAAGSLSKMEALEQVAEQTQAGIPRLIASSGGVFKDLALSAKEPNILAYTFTYTNQLDAESAAGEIHAEVEKIDKEGLCTQVYGELEAAGQVGPWQISYEYLNADSSPITTEIIDCP